MAYTLGFLCHFILDSNCHGYIYPKIKDGKVSHVEMETEFDRMLMVQQHIDPLNTNATDHLPVDKELSRIIAQIFVPLTPEQIYYGLRSMKFYHRLLVSPTPSKRYTIRRILRLTHTEQLLGGLIVNPVPNPLCRESNQKLMELYQFSLTEARQVMVEYYSSFLPENRSVNGLTAPFRHKALVTLPSKTHCSVSEPFLYPIILYVPSNFIV